VATLSCLEDFHFHLILHLKIHLAGQKFRKEEDVKNEVTTRVRAQAAECCKKKKNSHPGETNACAKFGTSQNS